MEFGFELEALLVSSSKATYTLLCAIKYSIRSILDKSHKSDGYSHNRRWPPSSIMNGGSIPSYSSKREALDILHYLCKIFDSISLPAGVASRADRVQFVAQRDLPYFPIPFKETETAAALKAIEASVASLLADTRQGETLSNRKIVVDLEKTTAFLFQAYLARIGGYGKLDKEVKGLLKGV